MTATAYSPRVESFRDSSPPPALVQFALESATEGCFSWCPTTDESYLSPRCRELLWPDAESQPDSLQRWFDSIHVEDRPFARDQLQQLLDGSTASFDFTFRHRPSTARETRWFQLRGHIERPTNEHAQIYGVIHDITRQRQTEKALRESEERYRSLVESQGEGIGIVDHDERFIFANPAGERIFGVPEGGLAGKSLRDFLSAAEFERVTQQTAQRRDGNTDTYELEICRPDGSSRVLLVTATARYDDEGTYTGAFGIFRDITDRKLVELAVKESEERYRQLIHSLPHGVAVVSNGAIQFVNRAGCKMFGFDSESELLGQSPLALLAEGEHEHVIESLGALHEGNATAPINYFARALRTDGTELPVEVIATKILHKGDDAFQLFMMDISDRQEAERSQAALEEKLRQAQKMESIGRLAGGIAHDFNNMLAPILSLAQVCQADTPPDSQLSSDLQTIIEAAERARDLTQQLLAFGRKQLLRMGTLDLNYVIRTAHVFLRRLIRENISIQLELTDEIGAVRADSSQINQILMNLTLNARDSMPEGGTIIVRTRNIEIDGSSSEQQLDVDPGSYVVFEVSDTGCGMDDETLNRVFEPFFSTKGQGQGTGLGLATVHGIVKQHEGTITVRSRLGRGSNFSIYLPRVSATRLDLQHSSWTLTSPRPEARILVVEDDGAVRRSACRILRKEGFDVVQARDGEEALVILRRTSDPVDVVLTDVIMPRMNGQELAQRLAVAYPSAAIVFMSGYTDDVIAHMGVLDEGTLFVQKPFSVRSLLAKIDEALSSAPRFSKTPSSSPRASQVATPASSPKGRLKNN